MKSSRLSPCRFEELFKAKVEDGRMDVLTTVKGRSEYRTMSSSPARLQYMSCLMCCCCDDQSLHQDPLLAEERFGIY